VNGKMIPTWEHVLFDQPYNQAIAGRQRITAWVGWESQVEGIR
jgi:hypothetical protein